MPMNPFAHPRPARLAALCLTAVLGLLIARPAGLRALEEPLPAYEKGLYDWTGNEWGLQHHLQALTGYDDNPLRGNYSRHPRADFNSRLDYGLVLGRYLNRTHYTRIAYDAQAQAWARYTDLNTVNHTLDARLNHFDPQIDVTGAGWLLKPRLLASVRKAPQDFIAGAAPRRLHLNAVLPVGYQFAADQVSIAPTWLQERYLDGGFAVLDHRDIGGYLDWELGGAQATAAAYLRVSYRSIAFRRNDLFNNFSVHALRLGWRQQTADLTLDAGFDAALFSRQSNRSADGTPQSQVNLSPYLDLVWEIKYLNLTGQVQPQITRVNFTLRRFFAPDTAVSATALTRADLRLTHVVAPDLIDVGLLSRLAVSSRLGAGSATLVQFQADANLRVEKGDWPPVTVIATVGLDVNRDDDSTHSYLARTAQLGFRAVF